MITEQQAELLANQVITDYITKCSCKDAQDATNAIAKLVVVSGYAMCAVSDVKSSVIRLRATADYIEKENPTFDSYTMQ